MTITADVRLVQLDCIRETEDGGSTPYLWVVLLQTDLDAIKTVGVCRVGWTREYEQVLANGLKTGQWASIPTDLLEGPGASWAGGVQDPTLIIAAALWDKHDTPPEAVEAGYGAFVDTLTQSVADEMEALYTAEVIDPGYVTTIIGQIESVVENAVHRAIKSKLDWEEELFDTLDSFIDTSFQAFFPVTTSAPIQLTFNSHPDHSYSVGGELVVVISGVPVRPPIPAPPPVPPIASDRT
jgi:hypothetical protein